MDAPTSTDLMNAIIELREATELGFANFERFLDRRFDEMDERWERRFTALGNRLPK